MLTSARPIGVFDSGVGGLSVLQALHRLMPHERFVYLADSAHAPYGEKSDAEVQARALAVTDHLIRAHRIKALVVACNTATAAAIQLMRAQHPQMVIVGLEPAIKPAVGMTRTGRIGVMATRGTTQSQKFKDLLATLEHQAEYVVCACDGLALAIEQSTRSAHMDTAPARITDLISTYTGKLGPWGDQPGQMDTLVLGCTHYVFAHDEIQAKVGPKVTLIHTGDAVAVQTRRRLTETQQLSNRSGPIEPADMLGFWTTGDLDSLKAATQRWLQLPRSLCHQAEEV